MADNLLGIKPSNNLLGDVRESYIAKAKGRNFSDYSEEESAEARKRHPSTSYFDSYENFLQTDNDFTTPLMQLIMEQPDKDISEIFSFPQNSEEGPTRKSTLRGTYDPQTDVIELIRDPVADSFSGNNYEVYGATRPFFTKIGQDFTAAHEMIHAALNRNVRSKNTERYQLGRNVQHSLIDYFLPKNLLNNKEFWKKRYGEQDYRAELANQVIRLSYEGAKLGTALPKQISENFSDTKNKRPSLRGIILSTKDMSIEDLEKALDYNLSRLWWRRDSLKVDIDKAKEMIGKPESKKFGE